MRAGYEYADNTSLLNASDKDIYSIKNLSGVSEITAVTVLFLCLIVISECFNKADVVRVVLQSTKTW